MFSTLSTVSASNSHGNSEKKGDFQMLPAAKGAIRFWQR